MSESAGTLRSELPVLSLIPTQDPTCFIEDCGPGWVVYRTTENERWVIRGTCNCCGECEVGAVNQHLVWTGIPVGQPGACIDSRKDRRDCPVRPEISKKCPSCTLRGEYL